MFLNALKQLSFSVFFFIFEAKLQLLKCLAVFHFNGSLPCLSQGTTWSSQCLKLDAVIRASLCTSKDSSEKRLEVGAGGIRALTMRFLRTSALVVALYK